MEFGLELGGLGSKFVPKIGPLHHAAIWVEGTLIEVYGKQEDSKIFLNIQDLSRNNSLRLIRLVESGQGD